MNKEEIEKYLNDNHLSYNNAVRNDLGELIAIGDLVYNKTKELQERVEELNASLLDVATKSANKVVELQSRIDELEKVNEKHIESLNYVRNNPKTWKSGGIGGQDQYAGMPPMLRYIDEIIDNLTTLKQTKIL